jgi:hypothetical protein
MMLMMSGMGLANALAGEASTSATAENGWRNPGSAGATANYDGDGGIGFARTHSDTGQVNHSRGLAVGFDRDGLDFSFSHAIAPKFGPAYAGTFNLSIGMDGSVNGGYGNSVARGGEQRAVEAGGTTRSDLHGGTTLANASGRTHGGGTVQADTQTYHRKVVSRRIQRTSEPHRFRRG